MMKYSNGGQVIGGPLKEMKAKRPNPYDGNEPSADDIERASEGEKFAKGGMAGKKGAIMAIVAKLAKKPSEIGSELEKEGEGMEESGEGMMGEAKMTAASEVMSALKGGDVSAFSSALENFMKACGEYED
jgi:hypothetical protein